ncbi:MAG: hypothetical protein JRG91_20340 [Deltaproteobacteria bacterium]|nr:hypothetical protein [Deltaproteobacteria bacterium]
MSRSVSRILAITLALLYSCAGSKPATEEPEGTAQPPANTPAPGPDEVAPEGKKVWEAIPMAPHGQCCTSDDECGPITCEPYEYAISSCERVCTYSCEPGDICPVLGGSLGPAMPCPESGLCPVGPPWV